MISFFILIDNNCNSNYYKPLNIHWNQIKYCLFEKIKKGIKINLYVYILNNAQINVIIENANINQIKFEKLIIKIEEILSENPNRTTIPIPPSSKITKLSQLNNIDKNYKKIVNNNEDKNISIEIYSRLLVYLFYDIINPRDKEQMPIKSIDKIDLGYLNMQTYSGNPSSKNQDDLISLYSYYCDQSTNNDDPTVYQMEVMSSDDEENNIDFCQSPIRSERVNKEEFNRKNQIVNIDYLYPKNQEKQLTIPNELPTICGSKSNKRKKNTNYFLFLNDNSHFLNFNRLNELFKKLKPRNCKLSEFILINININEQLIFKTHYDYKVISEKTMTYFENCLLSIDYELEDKISEFLNNLENDNNSNKNYLKNMNKNIEDTINNNCKFHSDVDRYINEINNKKSNLDMNTKKLFRSKSLSRISSFCASYKKEQKHNISEFPNIKYNKLNNIQ